MPCKPNFNVQQIAKTTKPQDIKESKLFYRDHKHDKTGRTQDTDS